MVCRLYITLFYSPSTTASRPLVSRWSQTGPPGLKGIVALIKRFCEQIGLDQGCFAVASALSISEMMQRTRHRRLSSVQVYKRSEDSFRKTAN